MAERPYSSLLGGVASGRVSDAGPYMSHRLFDYFCNHHLDLACLVNGHGGGTSPSLYPCRSLDIDLGSGFDGDLVVHLAGRRGRGHDRDPVYRHVDFLGFLQEMVSAMF